jgi:hypothetical protein
MIVFLVLVGIGIVAIFIGRNLRASDEEARKSGNSLSKFVLGPPGYYRSVAIRGGFLLILLGLLGVVWRLFF